MKKVSYSFSLITYLDILGFRNLIERKTPGQISRLIRTMKETATPGPEESRAHKMQSITFSDTTIRIIPLYTPINLKSPFGHFFGELLSLLHVQFRLATQNIIVRGAVTAGDIVKSWGVLYGPGLVRAYELELQARWPRIIIDPGLFEELKTNKALRRHEYEEELRYIQTLIRKDADGFWFIDYLRAIETEMDEPEDNYPAFLQYHAQLIASGLTDNRNDGRILAKYQWLRDYHNSIVNLRFTADEAAGLLV